MTRKEAFAFIIELAILLESFSVVSSRSACQDTPLRGKKLLLVSMDGFRYDYLQTANTPNFDAMIDSGVTVPYVNNTFYTVTFPCHTSMATGLYQESHGIVDNVFYDPVIHDTFTYLDADPKWWNSSEPVWISAVKAGMKVGAFSWPGSEVDYKGYRPQEYRANSDATSFIERVKTVVDWFYWDDFDFGILYFSEPDRTGHKFGPSDPRTIEMIEKMDAIVGYMMARLKRADLQDKVDIIITSDHGMTDIDLQEKVIDVYDHVNETLLARVVQEYGAGLHLIPQRGKEEELVDALSGVEHMSVFLRADIPERFHYSHNDRITPVFALAEEGWSITGNRSKTSSEKLKGDHGYDNELMSMKPIFVASGPSFKRGYRLPGSIKSVDIYPLLCQLLQLTPAPNNGSLETMMPLLRNSSEIAVVASLFFNFILSCIIRLLI